jgi:RND family efflux transporter MFP subunit
MSEHTGIARNAGESTNGDLASIGQPAPEASVDQHQDIPPDADGGGGTASTHDSSGRHGNADASGADADADDSRGVLASILVGGLKAMLALGLLVGGVYAAWWFNATEGRVQASDEERREASRLVETVTVERGETRVFIDAMGVVTAAREATLRPRVSGMIEAQHDKFVPGGFFETDEFMVQIERADYEQALVQRESELAQAEAALQIELGDQAVAEEELELLQVDIPEINRDLILRKPQVNRARAEKRSAEAAVVSAKLDLERTRITAPFDGHVVERLASVGNNVTAGDALATFVGAERYWIDVAVPVVALRWIETPTDAGERGSPAQVRFPRGWAPDEHREGYVTQRIGRLEEGSRLARIIVSVFDPLARSPENTGEPELVLDAFVDVRIAGRVLDDAVALDRDLVRDDDTTWVMGDDDRLETRELTIAYRGQERAYVVAGLNDGDRVVRTNLTMPVDGMLLRDAADEPTKDPAIARADAGMSDG